MAFMRQGFRLTTLLALALMTTQGAHKARAEASKAALTQVKVRGQGGRAEVVLDGNFEAPSYAVRTRDGGNVVVIDVAGASLENESVLLGAGADLVKSATASTSAQGVRIELSLREPASYRARVKDGDIIVALEELDAASTAAVPVAGDKAELATASSGEGRSSEVRNVLLERRDGRERVVVELSRPAEFRVYPGAVGPARLEIKGAAIGASAQRKITREGLEVVKGVQVSHDGDRVLVEVERTPDSSGTAIREGNRIVWLFAPSERAEAGTPKPRTLVPAAPVEIDSEEVASFVSGQAMQAKSGTPTKYTGRRIDLDFKDADIHNILRLLAEVGGVNVVTSDDVSGSVTIRMRDVPWDQALDVILQAKGLGAERKGNLIRVAPQEVLEKERELALARQKQQVALAPVETRLVPVSYATAKDVEPRVRELLTERGNVSVDERTNVLIVRDIIESLDDVEELVRTLDTQTAQVLVEARIVEATSNYVRDVGIQWGGDVSFNQAFGNQTGLVFPSNIGMAGGAYDGQTPTQGLSPLAATTPVPNFAVNLPAATGTGAGGALGLTFGSVDGNYNLNVRLSAAESTGAVKIISSPRVLTLDNHAAKISQGTQIPYSQVSAQGVQTAFQTAVLELSVTPHVTADGSVAMKVHVTRNEPDFTRTGANGQPTILKREANTELLIADGHTAVIGGIYTRNSGRTVDQVPFFGDIPILGLLFQRRRMLDQRSELLIFITPRIVNRDQALMSAQK
ncbi:MAG: type IV pilus secretin PilQ [Myxococcales bacterium]